MASKDTKDFSTIKKKSWEEFRSNKMLWFVNTILHLFGWAIVYSLSEDDKVIDVFPARVAFRGFGEAEVTSGYKELTKYLKDNIDEIYEDID